ncbi:hypothetical protein XA68_12592 [Ophiocordyceps unilateralis]|uniref:Uncharacterized protein n=1 Tax=Ophiocordyceps unilateralis TaxID=268505 RepID=A0A2A9PEM7_OPHUN|nr:hypothetical protein XA68_12592 [Ophiocordyceps unilateralis]
MHKWLVSSCLALLIGAASANPKCGKNAWIHWTVENSGSDKYDVKVKVDSGKGSGDITSDTVVKAFTDCANRRQKCGGELGTVITCNHSPDTHPGNGAGGHGNIEFDCSDGPYTCYDFSWNT